MLVYADPLEVEVIGGQVIFFRNFFVGARRFVSARAVDSVEIEEGADLVNFRAQRPSARGTLNSALEIMSLK